MKITKISARIFAITFMAIANFSTITPAIAQVGDPVEMKLIGKIKDQPLFQLDFTGAEDNEYTIVVRDAYNNVLYRDVYKGGTGHRKFMLTEEAASADIRFEITGRSLVKPIVFEVNNQSRTVQDVVISRVK